MGKVFPLFGVFHYIFSAGCVVFLDRNFFTDVFLCNAQCFFYPQFYGQSVSIPASFTHDLETFHCFISAKNIFDGTGHDVMYTRHTVGRRRSFVKNKRRCTFSYFQAFMKDLFVVPFFQHFFIYRR